MFRCLRLAALFVLLVIATVARSAEPPAGLSAADVQQISADLKSLDERLQALKKALLTARKLDLIANAEVFRKGVVWPMRYETKLEPADVALIRKALKRCAERVDSLESGKPSWPTRTGKSVRGYISDVDGSVQPVGVIVPTGYDPKKPTWSCTAAASRPGSANFAS